MLSRRGWLITLTAAMMLIAGCGSGEPAERTRSYTATASAGPGSGTETVVLAPVDSSGNVAAGWLKDRSDGRSPIDCSSGAPSPYDVGTGVRWCGSNADGGDACWPTAGGNYVLCLSNPFGTVLRLLGAAGADSPLKPRRVAAYPMALVLDDGDQCRAVLGGAWGLRGAPEYTCGNATGIWSAPDRPGGIDRRSDDWVVEVGSEDGPPDTPRRVKTAYFVGMG